MDFESTLKNYQNKINQAIPLFLPQATTIPSEIHEAMLYSLQGGGKRIRPILLLATFDLQCSGNNPLPAAIAIECLHTYSLIHDDLPCMDNSPLRRGRPTSHIQFSESTAVLAGDALLTYAFFLLSNHYKHIPELACNLILELSYAGGSTKLIGGQIEDLKHQYSQLDNEKLDFIHENKTAALISAALVMGLQIAGANSEKIEIARKLGYHLGLAYQITDDILDLTASSQSLGKSSRIDVQNNTLTFPKVYGIENSYQKAKEHTNIAIEFCRSLEGNNRFLIDFIRSLEHRLS